MPTLRGTIKKYTGVDLDTQQPKTSTSRPDAAVTYEALLASLGGNAGQVIEYDVTTKTSALRVAPVEAPAVVAAVVPTKRSGLPLDIDSDEE